MLSGPLRQYSWPSSSGPWPHHFKKQLGWLYCLIVNICDAAREFVGWGGNVSLFFFNFFFRCDPKLNALSVLLHMSM